MDEVRPPVEIPDKATFKASEVCELLSVPSYVLRTWENEFKDLGVAKSPGGARTYRRSDVELALRIKDLVFREHLTLAGVRRRLEQEHLLVPPPEEDFELPPPAARSLAEPMRTTLTQVKSELRSLLHSLAQAGTAAVAHAQPSVAEQASAGSDGTTLLDVSSHHAAVPAQPPSTDPERDAGLFDGAEADADPPTAPSRRKRTSRKAS